MEQMIKNWLNDYFKGDNFIKVELWSENENKKQYKVLNEENQYVYVNEVRINNTVYYSYKFENMFKIEL